MVIIASFNFVSRETTGRLSFLKRSCTFIKSFFPKLPPGWKEAKSSFLKSLFFIKQTARASPIAIVNVVEDVGAVSRGQASFST